MQSCRSSLVKLPRNLKRLSLKPTTTQTRTMAFFPRNFYSPEATSFTPLFRLLDDFDSYTRETGGQGQGRRAGLPSWQPKFDICETADNYELHGELPGINKEHVHIEFTDPQTMLIRGKVERTYSSGTPPAGHIQDAAARGAIAEGEESDNKSSHQASVEDEDANKSTSQVVTQKPEQKKPVDKNKFWLTERSIGEFSRSFNFPSRVEQEEVNANFKDGILSITVPKAKKRESRRIAIN